MFWLIYLLSAILCIWGGCLLARVIANRLELGLFRRKQRKENFEADGAQPSSMPTIRKRSGWWTLVGLGVMLIGGVVTFLGYEAQQVGTSWFGRFEDYRPFVVTLLVMSLGLSGGLAVVGWRFDPSLGRRRCPKCWYDLSATKGLLCNECGHEAVSERQLFRSRRSRMTIALAIIPLLLVPIVHRGLYAWRVGWVGLIPTSVMVIAWEWLPESAIGTMPSSWTGVGQEPGTLFSRVERQELWDWQESLLRWRAKGTLSRATNAKQMIRAVMFSQERSDLPWESSVLRPNIVKMILSTDWKDPESRLATQWLMGYVWSFDDSEVVVREIAKGVPAIKGAILAQWANATPTWGSDGLELLGLPGVSTTYTEEDWSAIGARVLAPRVPAWQRYRELHFVAQMDAERLAKMVLTALDSLDQNTMVDVLGAALHVSTNEALVAKGVSLLRTSQEPLAGDIVKALATVQTRVVREAAYERFGIDFAGGKDAYIELSRPAYFVGQRLSNSTLSNDDARLLSELNRRIFERGENEALMLAAINAMLQDDRYSASAVAALQRFLETHPNFPHASQIRTILRRHDPKTE